jgi:integrase
MYQVLFSVMLVTGCRIGEICVLTWDNNDFENNCIHICRHFIVDKNGSTEIQNGCKTHAGDRWLTMDNSIMDMLRENKAYCEKTAEKYGSKWNYDDNAVFFAVKRYCSLLNSSTARS